MTLKSLRIVSGLLRGLVPNAFAADIFILATGRRDPRIFAIDFKEALKAENRTTTPPSRSNPSQRCSESTRRTACNRSASSKGFGKKGTLTSRRKWRYSDGSAAPVTKMKRESSAGCHRSISR